MKNISWITCCLLAILLGAPVCAEPENNDDAFRDWFSLTDYLNSKGINPTSVNWRVIEPMCLGLKKESQEIAYNKCKYKKALDSILHPADRAQCLVRAKAVYPQSLLNLNRTEALQKIGNHGEVHRLARIVYPISARELDSLRYGAVVECMQNLGWLNADEWSIGKRRDFE